MPHELEQFLAESRLRPGAVLEPEAVIGTTLAESREQVKRKALKGAGTVGGEFALGVAPEEPEILAGLGVLGGGKLGLAIGAAGIAAEAAELDTALFNILKGAFLDVAGFAAGQVVGGAKQAIESVLPGQQFAEIGVGGDSMPQPGQQIAVQGIQVGGQAPGVGQITKVWDTWPGRGVTGGGRAPIFFRTVGGQTFVRKIDGTIKKVPRSRNIVINSRKINLDQYIRAERRLDTISKRIAKRVRSLKRA